MPDAYSRLFDRVLACPQDSQRRAIDALPFWHNLGLKAILAACWPGDLDLALALATARRMPRSAQQEDWGMSLIDRIHEMRREPKERLKFLESVPREWIASNLHTGPKVLLTGFARLTDGAVELARRRPAAGR